MFPNVRLMIGALFASVVALTCGFGIFAAFRVNHEPLSRLPANTVALQLVANEVAGPPEAWTAPMAHQDGGDEVRIAAATSNAPRALLIRTAAIEPGHAWSLETIRSQLPSGAAEPPPPLSVSHPSPAAVIASPVPPRIPPPSLHVDKPIVTPAIAPIPMASTPSAVTPPSVTRPVLTASASAPPAPTPTATAPAAPKPTAPTPTARVAPSAPTTPAVVATIEQLPQADPRTLQPPGKPKKAAKAGRETSRPRPRKIVRKPIERRRVVRRRVVRQTATAAASPFGGSNFSTPVFSSAPTAFESQAANRRSRTATKSNTAGNGYGGTYAWPNNE